MAPSLMPRGRPVPSPFRRSSTCVHALARRDAHSEPFGHDPTAWGRHHGWAVLLVGADAALLKGRAEGYTACGCAESTHQREGGGGSQQGGQGSRGSGDLLHGLSGGDLGLADNCAAVPRVGKTSAWEDLLSMQDHRFPWQGALPFSLATRAAERAARHNSSRGQVAGESWVGRAEGSTGSLARLHCAGTHAAATHCCGQRCGWTGGQRSAFCLADSLKWCTSIASAWVDVRRGGVKQCGR